LEKPGSISGIEQTFFHLPILVSSTTDEGKAFVPGDLSTDDQFTQLLHTISPGLTKRDLADLDELYLSPVKYPHTSPYINSPRSTQFDRVAAAYGDYSYICPVQETAFRTSVAGIPTWKARFNTPNYNAAWAGIPHAADSKYFNGLPDVEHPDISYLYHAYYASFVVSGDPNIFSAQGSPYWEQYNDSRGKGHGLQLVVSPNGMTGMEKEMDGMRFEQCQWWRQPDRMRRLNK
jgi:carboxylesterase type B